jgi:hypothetical protein
MRYRSIVADNVRWDSFEFRPGDIVISTPPKSGTTWTQMLCALLIFDGPRFPATLEHLSYWVDMLNKPLDSMLAGYAAQTHRRFMKTHTPLDGLPLREDVTYVVVGRDPRDVVVSMEHHMANMNLDRFIELRAQAVGLDDLAEFGPPMIHSDDPSERFREFVHSSTTNRMTLASVLHHLDTAWQRRRQPNVAMFHYADYRADLPNELMRLAAALDIELTPTRAAELAREACLDKMRDRTDEVVPNASTGQWKDNRAFLRAGASGEWRDRCDEADLAAYDQRVSALISSELAAWSHLGRVGSGIDPNARP